MTDHSHDPGGPGRDRRADGEGAGDGGHAADGDAHSHDHDHHDAERDPNSDHDLEDRVRAIQSLLVEKGLLTTDAVDAVIQDYEEEIGPLNGARVVARAWTDPEYKAWLLEDATAAVADFDFEVGEQHLEVVENTPEVHNVVVCTLCSCYPWSLLGLPPTWYKSPAYRSRVVREPRAVLREFGVDLDESVDVRVQDSNSDLRYAVLPQRPPGTEGMGREELTGLVTRDSMIGVDRLGEP
ncbi:MAG: nitrile hydratase subunit alpha [Haloferacaceae archaeon]